MHRILFLLCFILFGMNARAYAQTESGERPIRLPSTDSTPDTGPTDFKSTSTPEEIVPIELPRMWTFDEDGHSSLPEELPLRPPREPVSNAFATLDSDFGDGVKPIPAFVIPTANSNRVVRYEVPLTDGEMNQVFQARGFRGKLIEVTDESEYKNESISDRLKAFISPASSRREAKKVRLVRYEVPANDIQFHAQVSDLDGQLLEPGMLRVPEVRFFQPKARVFMDLKQGNDDEFDLFKDGAILASLDVIELYFPMPLVSERFAETFGKSGHLNTVGWRVGGTIGLGITTALNNGTTDNGSAPVSTLATGIRYEFPLGRPSRELLETGDLRLDQRTRVGMEFGVQGGISTRESLNDATDIGLYFGVLVNTPWGS